MSSTTPEPDARLDAWRADTPGCAEVVHFNNAGASLPTNATLAAVVEHLTLEARVGGYEAADARADAIAATYGAVGELVGGRAEDVSLHESATTAWAATVGGFPFRAGDRVLVTSAEYASSAVQLHLIGRRIPLEVVVLRDDEYGQVSLDHLRDELDRGAAMVTATHVPTSGGLVNPVEDVGALCRAAGVPLAVDAAQSIGQLPLDVARIGCDILVGTGRKYLRGPRGTAVAWVHPELVDRLVPSVADTHSARWHSDGRIDLVEGSARCETWERSIALQLGLGAAVRQALEADVATTWPRVRSLGERLRERLAGCRGVTVHDTGAVRGGIVTFTTSDRSSDELHARLVATGHNCSVARAGQAQLDLGARGLGALVRASVHYYNTDDEIDRFVDAVERR